MHLAAIHRIVVFVGMCCDLTIRQKHPSPRLRNFFKVFLLFFQEWCSWPLLIYGEFRVGHEVVDGVLVLGFLNAFVEGTMERFDHFDLSLDTVQAPEPEDLASAQLHLCVVNLVQPLSILGDLLLGGAMSSFLQEFQGLGRYCGDYLAPQQFANTNEETPEPLGQGEVRAAEGLPSKFHNENLADECAQDHRAEDEVAKDARKDIPLFAGRWL